RVALQLGGQLVQARLPVVDLSQELALADILAFDNGDARQCARLASRDLHVFDQRDEAMSELGVAAGSRRGLGRGGCALLRRRGEYDGDYEKGDCHLE